MPAAPVPPLGAVPVLTSSGPLPLAGPGSRFLAKPVVAADRDRRVVVVAMCGPDDTTMRLDRWRSADGGKTWDEPVPFPKRPPECDFLADPWVQTDHRDHFHLVHLATSFKARAGARCVYRRSRDGGGTWPTVVRVAKDIDRPVLAVSPGGERVVIVGMTSDPTAAPLTAAEVSNPNRSAAAAATNRVFTAGVFLSGNRGQTWGRVAGPPGVRHAVPFGAAVDDSGRVAACWVANDGNGSRSVVATTADRGATWARAEFVLALQPDRPHPFNGGRFPVLALDGAGRLHALYVEAGGKAVSARVSSDWRGWSDPVRLSADGPAEVRFPAVAAAGDVVHAVWMERSGNRYQVCYRGSRDGGASWSGPLTLSRPHPGSAITAEGFEVTSDDDQASVTDDGAGTAHVVWALRGKPAWAVWHATVRWQTPGR